MKRHILPPLLSLLTLIPLLPLHTSAQTLNVIEGSVTTRYTADQAGEMTYSDGGASLTIGGKTFATTGITITIDDTEVEDNTVSVAYDGTSASVVIAGNVAPYVTAEVSGAHVSITQTNTDDIDGDEITYVLTGTSTDGEFYMSGSYKATVELNGLTLTNATPVYSGAAVHIQDGKRIKVSVKKGTENTLHDASTGGSQKACLYVKGHLELKGQGTLNVYGNYAHAIKSGEYMQVKNCTINVLSAVKDGLSCNEYFLMESGTVSISGVGDDGIQADIDGSSSTGETTDHDGEDSGNIYIEDGILTISVTADASKGLKADGDVRISGGTITANTSGGGTWDSDDAKTKACAGLSADGNITISGGTYNSTSTGAGGKGISGDGTLTITDGTLNIKTSGKIATYVSSKINNSYTISNAERLSSNYKSSPKGIKIDGAIQISGGTISVEAYHEGIESKSTIDISGGYVYCKSEDDAINSSSTFTISGGYVCGYSTGNDGLDANGNFYIKGGLVYAIGTSSPEVAIDANTEGGYKLYVQGGTVIAIGGLESGSSLSQSCYQASSWSKNTWYSMTVGSETIAFKTPASGGSGLVFSASSQPTVLSGVTASGTAILGDMVYAPATVSGGSSVSLSSYSGGNGGGGGNQPGGGGGGPGGGGGWH